MTEQFAFGNNSEPMTFSHAEGRETTIPIGNKRLITDSGMYGDVYDVTMQIGKHVRHFVLKEFKDNEYGTAQENVQKALGKYKLAQRAGLKILPTYRVNEDGTKVLMTSEHDEDWSCVSVNKGAAELSDFGKEKMEIIENFDTLLREVFGEAIKAAQYRVSLYWDAFFFLVNEKLQRTDYVLGDFDNIQFESYKSFEELTKDNLKEVFLALKFYLEHNVKTPPSIYCKRIFYVIL